MNKSVSFFVLFLAIFAKYASADEKISSDWQQFRRNENCDGSIYWENIHKNQINEWHLKRDKVKNRKYSRDIPVWTSPALAVINEIPMAFAGACDQTLYALNLSDKKVQWTKITNGNIIDSPTVANFAGQQNVFFSSSDRTVYCCDAFTGKLFWTKELIAPSNTISGAELSSPTFFDGKLYLNVFVYDRSLPRNEQKAELFVLSAFDGNILSRIPLSNGPVSPPLAFKLNQNSYLCIAAKKGLLICFSIDDGIPLKLWSYQMPNEVLGAPSFLSYKNKGYIFIGSKYGSLVSLDAETGSENWKFMAGNWIDNTASTGIINQTPIVFTGSHDYKVYAINAVTGDKIWASALGGEIFSAPVLFKMNQEYFIAVASLNNYIYILRAADGVIVNSYFTGNPIWDKINKGDTLWGSPSVLSADEESAIVFGSTSGDFYILPLQKECSMRVLAKKGETLWQNLFVSGIIITSIIFYIIRKKYNREMIEK